METQVKGGFPRIVVEIGKLDSKKEQGFSTNKIYSIKNMMTTKPNAPIAVGPKNTVNIISHINGSQIGGNKKEVRINGIPLSVFAK